MSDFQILQTFIKDYNRLVCQEINEIPTLPSLSPNSEYQEFYTLLYEGVNAYKGRRNTENIMFGQLGLGLFALQQGNFIPIHIEQGSTSMVAETIEYFNRFVVAMQKTAEDIRILSEAVRKGDFTVTVGESQWEGNMLNLVEGINRLLAEINLMLSESYTNGVKLSQSADNLKQSTESLSSATTQQAAALDQTVASLEELSEQVQTNTEHTVRMSIIANEAKSAVEEGNVLVKHTVDAVTEINRATEEMHDALKIIDNIASQTNILSLNAAIEATRAGTAGRGFAVVAVEVRKLAARSAEAAKNIRNLSDIAYTKSDEALKISDRMIRGFKTINTKISETATIVGQVALASNEQMLGITQINRAVHELETVTESNSQIAEDTDCVAQEVSVLATQIVEDTSSKKFIS
ncbi:methyl-accepting chemotaxis protein [Sulfuricurvum sp.]|uniref:methyl-accepting chemotaxis protein n=1 Tax=Sulfuricurvum sp. TaxID=2025608 RepID=UPI0035632C30